MTNVTQITDFTKIDLANNCIEFARNNQVYIICQSDIDFDHFTNTVDNLSNCSNQLAIEIADYYHHFKKAINVTEEYLEELDELANSSTPTVPTLKSVLFYNAWDKWKNGVKNFSICLKDSWNDLKLTTAIIVQFVKQEDLELDNPPIQTRIVRFIQRLKDGRFLFQDTENPTKRVSFYSYQLQSWQ